MISPRASASEGGMGIVEGDIAEPLKEVFDTLCGMEYDHSMIWLLLEMPAREEERGTHAQNAYVNR
jgi:hypothetical protein